MKSLLIVESPAKAKTINKILGNLLTVKASVGHVRDLPEKELAVDIEDNFAPSYKTIPGKEKVIRELRKAAGNADVIYLAPDPDREGEAIAWHIAEALKGGKGSDSKSIYRVTFNEITERVVKESIRNPEEIDMKKVDAQQARRVLDRLVGYKLSPLLCKKVQRGLSAGRVQSVAMRLVVEREREIEAFNTVEYWNITGFFEGALPPEFKARLYKYDQKRVTNREREEFLLRDESSSQSLVEELRASSYRLENITRKLRKRKPSSPFITSTLQQEASRKLRFAPRRTMAVAQQLYSGVDLGREGSVGLITYMRTDSVRVAVEAQAAARDHILERYGKEYLPKNPPLYKKKSQAQDAHEAIRPTYLSRPPESIKSFLTREQYSLYRLIWMRFVASQMVPADIEKTSFLITDEDASIAEFGVSGDVLRFKGFMAVYIEGTDSSESEDENAGLLPPLKEGERLSLKELNALQHFTQPPPRYTEAALVKALEEKGIGRPSTYATILSVIQQRKYVKKEDGKLVPSELAKVINDLLVERFQELMDINFTAKMEEKLDSIEDGKYSWPKVVDSFYKPFALELLAAEDMTLAEETDVTCGECGEPMLKKWGRYGWFLACSKYPECKNTKPLDEESEDLKPAESSDEKCPECSAPMVIKEGRYGRFLACSRYPECKTTKPLDKKDGEERPVELTDEKCPECSAPMVIKEGRYGKFLGCSNYPKCKGISQLGTGIKCPLDDGEIVEKRSRRGKIFWSCSNWPKCKFASWNKLVDGQCPDCGEGYLLEKKTRDGKRTHFCPKKECKYSVIVEDESAS